MKKSVFHKPKLLLFLLCPFIILSAGAIIIKYEYDGAGNRVVRYQENGIIISPLKTKKNLNDSISKLMSEKTVKLYPNPTNGPLTIDISNLSGDEMVNATVSKINGEHVYTTSIKSSHETLNLSNYSGGWYLVTISIGDKSETWKVLKTN